MNQPNDQHRGRSLGLLWPRGVKTKSVLLSYDLPRWEQLRDLRNDYADKVGRPIGIPLLLWRALELLREHVDRLNTVQDILAERLVLITTTRTNRKDYRTMTKRNPIYPKASEVKDLIDRLRKRTASVKDLERSVTILKRAQITLKDEERRKLEAAGLSI